MLEAWRRGMTGFPLVDAGMRELWATAWMQQNVRMACACFLTEVSVDVWMWCVCLCGACPSFFLVLGATPTSTQGLALLRLLCAVPYRELG